MLAELAAINAAYGVIKEVVGNGQELYAAGQYVAQFFNTKYELQKKLNEKPPDQRNQLEEFFALEEIKAKEQELKELMIIAGRPGLWDDWLQFQADQARARREEIARLEREAYLKRQRIKRWAEYTVAGLITAATVYGLASMIIFILSYNK
jgi:hypothetical protein